MADMNDLGFDANKVDPNQGFDLMPAGEYDAVIVNSEVKPTANGEGKYLKLELQILSGQFQNRKLWDNLNLWNKSEEAVKIAKGSLSSICRAVGVMTPKDSTELHNKPLRVSVKIKKEAQYGDKNVIGSYKSRATAPAGVVPGVPAMAGATGQPSTTNANPWG